MIRIVSYTDGTANYWTGRGQFWSSDLAEAETYQSMRDASTARGRARRRSPDRKIVLHTGDSVPSRAGNPVSMGLAAASMPDGLRDAAWSGFIQWAHGFPEIRERFTAETGLSLEPRTGIVALVDNATGFREDVLKRFVEWATREIWGLEYAPKKYRDELEGRS